MMTSSYRQAYFHIAHTGVHRFCDPCLESFFSILSFMHLPCHDPLVSEMWAASECTMGGSHAY